MTVPSSHAASQTRALWIIAVLVSAAGLQLAASLLIPIVLAVLTSLALAPLVEWLVKWGVPRLAAAALVLLALFGGLGAGVYAMKDRIVTGVQALPDAFRRAETMVEEQLDAVGVGNGTTPPEGGPAREGSQAPPSSSTGEQAPDSAGETLAGAMGGAAAAAQRVAQTVMALSGHLMVVVFLMFFLLQAGPETRERIVAMAGTEERRRTVSVILTEVYTQIQRFLVVQLLTGVLVAVATWAALAWMETDNAFVWALLAGAFNSIPYFGPVIVSGGLFIVGMVQGGASEGVRLALTALAITSLEGWLIRPPLMGRAERMNALSVFLGLLVWTWLWGAWGTLLAVPMLAVMKSVSDRVEGLKPVGRLMAE